MLSADRKAVLDALKEIAGEDGLYKVVDADEVIEKLPETQKMSLTELSSVIKDLRDREYIKVKYLTLDEYCLLVLKHEEELKQFVEEVAAATVGIETQAASTLQVPTKVKQQKASKAPQSVDNAKPKTFRSFVAGFFGAFFGGGIVMLIGFLLQHFVF